MDDGVFIDRVDKAFRGRPAVAELSFDVAPGEIVAVTGPSEAGKTTICRLLAGLEWADRGAIRIGGREMTAVPAERRGVSMMFESYALYPLMSVAENVAFPLLAPTRAGRHDAADVARRVEEVLALTEISALRERMPHELSGGQKQRVALSRALVQDPNAYVMDEPISHLDAKLRHTLRGSLRRRFLAAGKPTLWCTPDAMEALTVADRVAVLVGGRLQQIGAPEAVYRRPGNVEVARLVGDPPMNLFHGALARRDGGLAFVNRAVSLPLAGATRARVEAAGERSEVVLGVRPTDLEVADEGAAAGEVYVFEPFGKYSVVTLRIGGDMVKIKSFDARELEPESMVSVRFREAEFVVFDAATGAAI